MNPHDQAINTPRTSEIIYASLAVIAFIFFVIGIFYRAWFLDYSDQDSGIMDDHFINAIVAKNIANGNGWSTTGFETFPLNPDSLTTGPTLMLPVSLAIKIFGSGLNIPGLCTAFINTILLLLVMFLIYRYYNRDLKKSSQLILGLLLLFGCFMPHYWYRMIGEITAILLAISSVAILAHYPLEHYSRTSKGIFNFCFAGLLLGLAMATKHIMIMCFSGVLIVLLIDIFVIKKFRSKAIFVRVFGFLIFGILPLLLFKVYQDYTLSKQDYEWIVGVKLFQKISYKFSSGIPYLQQHYLSTTDTLSQYLATTLHHTSKNASAFFNGSFLQSYALIVWLGVFLLAGIGGILFWKQTPLAVYLIATAFLLCLWFFLIANAGLARYITTAVIFGFLALLVLIIEIRQDSISAPLLMLVFFIVMLCSGSPQNSRSSDGNPVKQKIPHPAFLTITASLPSAPSSYYFSAKEASDYLNQLPSPKKIYAMGMWNTNLFEYASPSVNIFTNFSDVFVDYFVFDEISYLQTYPEVAKLISQGEYTSGLNHYQSQPIKKGAFSYDLKTGVTRVGKQPVKAYQAKIKFRGFLEEKNASYFFVETKNFPDEYANRKPFCGKSALENDYFRITVCNQHELADSLKLFTNIGFRPMKWMRPRLIYAEDFKFF